MNSVLRISPGCTTKILLAFGMPTPRASDSDSPQSLPQTNLYFFRGVPSGTLRRLPFFLRFLRATAPKPDPAVAGVALIPQSPTACAWPWERTRAPRAPDRPDAGARSSARDRGSAPAIAPAIPRYGESQRAG